MKPEWKEIEKMCEEVFGETLVFDKNYVFEDSPDEEACIGILACANGLNRFLFTELMENSYKAGFLDTAESRGRFRNMITLLTSDKDNKISYNSMMLEVLDRIDRREKQLENMKNDLTKILGSDKNLQELFDKKTGANLDMIAKTLASEKENQEHGPEL